LFDAVDLLVLGIEHLPELLYLGKIRRFLTSIICLPAALELLLEVLNGVLGLEHYQLQILQLLRVDLVDLGHALF